MNRFQTGLPSIDVAAYRGPLPHAIPAATFRERGGMALQPELPGVSEVVVESIQTQVLACVLRPIRTLVDPFEGARGGVLQRYGFVGQPRGASSRWVIAEGQPETLHFHFSPSALAEAVADAGLVGFAVEERSFLAVGRPDLVACVQEGRREFLRGDGASILALESLHLRALVSSIRGMGSHRGVRQAPGSALTPARMRRLRDHVEARLGEDITLAEMAEVVGVSRPHFARIFREATGTSPYRWVQGLRVERACTMLVATDEPIAAIALACGFGSQSHFSQVFNAAMGVPPRRWRASTK